MKYQKVKAFVLADIIYAGSSGTTTPAIAGTVDYAEQIDNVTNYIKDGALALFNCGPALPNSVGSLYGLGTDTTSAQAVPDVAASGEINTSKLLEAEDFYSANVDTVVAARDAGIRHLLVVSGKDSFYIPVEHTTLSVRQYRAAVAQVITLGSTTSGAEFYTLLGKLTPRQQLQIQLLVGNDHDTTQFAESYTIKYTPTVTTASPVEATVNTIVAAFNTDADRQGCPVTFAAGNSGKTVTITGDNAGQRLEIQLPYLGIVLDGTTELQGNPMTNQTITYTTAAQPAVGTATETDKLWRQCLASGGRNNNVNLPMSEGQYSVTSPVDFTKVYAFIDFLVAEPHIAPGTPIQGTPNGKMYTLCVPVGTPASPALPSNLLMTDDSTNAESVIMILKGIFAGRLAPNFTTDLIA